MSFVSTEALEFAQDYILNIYQSIQRHYNYHLQAKIKMIYPYIIKTIVIFLVCCVKSLMFFILRTFVVDVESWYKCGMWAH